MATLQGTSELSTTIAQGASLDVIPPSGKNMLLVYFHVHMLLPSIVLPGGYLSGLRFSDMNGNNSPYGMDVRTSDGGPMTEGLIFTPNFYFSLKSAGSFTSSNAEPSFIQYMLVDASSFPAVGFSHATAIANGSVAITPPSGENWIPTAGTTEATTGRSMYTRNSPTLYLGWKQGASGGGQYAVAPPFSSYGYNGGGNAITFIGGDPTQTSSTMFVETKPFVCVSPSYDLNCYNYNGAQTDFWVMYLQKVGWTPTRVSQQMAATTKITVTPAGDVKLMYANVGITTTGCYVSVTRGGTEVYRQTANNTSGNNPSFTSVKMPLGSTDKFELYNSSSSTVSSEYWTITDDLIL